MNSPQPLTDIENALPSYAAFMADYGTAHRTFGHGALHGIMSGIFVALPIIGTNALFERKGAKYILINSGYWIDEKPIYPLIQQLSKGHDYERLIAIFDDVDSVVSYIENNKPIPSSSEKWSFCSAHCKPKA